MGSRRGVPLGRRRASRRPARSTSMAITSTSQARPGAAAAAAMPSLEEDPWCGANPIDPAFRANPYPALARLREVDPVNLTPVGLWRLTRFADVERLLKEVPTGVRLS